MQTKPSYVYEHEVVSEIKRMGYGYGIGHQMVKKYNSIVHTHWNDENPPGTAAEAIFKEMRKPNTRKFQRPSAKSGVCLGIKKI